VSPRDQGGDWGAVDYLAKRVRHEAPPPRTWSGTFTIFGVVLQMPHALDRRAASRAGGCEALVRALHAGQRAAPGE